MIEFEPAQSPHVVGTVDAIRRRLGAGGPLLYRYPPGTDGLVGGEGAFLPCSFWLVQALARTGRHGEAEALFDELLSLGGPLGLYGEEMAPRPASTSATIRRPSPTPRSFKQRWPSEARTPPARAARDATVADQACLGSSAEPERSWTACAPTS